MVEYKKRPLIDDETIEKIKVTETLIIMENIKKSKVKEISMFRFNKAMIGGLTSILVIIGVLIIPGLDMFKVEHNPCDFGYIYSNGKCEIDDDYEPTWADFEEKLVEYIDYIESYNSDGEVYQSFAPMFLSNAFQVENQYFPDDFYDIYNNQVVDEFSDPFVDELFMTEMFLTEILNLIESNYNLKLDTYLRLETISEDVLFKFDITESQEIIVNRATPIERSVYIIGFTDGKLDISSITYSDEDTGDWKDSSSFEFNYFEYKEDRESVFINSYEDYFNTRYASFEEEKIFSVTHGNYVIEGEYEGNVGTLIRYYDPLSKVRSFYQIVDDVVVSDHYELFNDQGIVFTLDNYSIDEGLSKVRWNLLEATGWDYAVAADMSGSTNADGGMLYRDDVPLFTDEQLNMYLTERYAYLALTKDVLFSEIDDDLLSLNSYGLTFHNNSINLDFINNMISRDVSNLETLVEFKGLNFFETDVRESLYNYLNDDIKKAFDPVRDEDLPGQLNEEYNINIGETLEGEILYKKDYDKIYFTVTTAGNYSYKRSGNIMFKFELFNEHNVLITMNENSYGDESFSYDDLAIGDYYIVITNTNFEEETLDYTLSIHEGTVSENEPEDITVKEAISNHFNTLNSLESFVLEYNHNLNTQNGMFIHEIHYDESINRVDRYFRRFNDGAEDLTQYHHALINGIWYRYDGNNTMISNYIPNYLDNPYVIDTILNQLSMSEELIIGGTVVVFIEYDLIQSDYEQLSYIGGERADLYNPLIRVTLSYHQDTEIIDNMLVEFIGAEDDPQSNWFLDITYTNVNSEQLEPVNTENFILDDYPNSKNDSYTYILGETLNGVSNDLYDYDYIKFEVDSWSDYTFNISRTYNLRISVIDEDGKYIFNNTDNVSNVFTEKLLSGIYYLQVLNLEFDSNNNDYSIIVTKE